MKTILQKRKELKKLLTDSLELDYCFRDYRILPKNLFHKIHKTGIHRLTDIEDYRSDIEDSIDVFCRDGYSTIYFYI